MKNNNLIGNNVDYVNIGKKITLIMQTKSVSRTALSELTDLSLSEIVAIESATLEVDLPSLINIANALGVSLDELVCDSLEAPYTIVLTVEGESDSGNKEKRSLKYVVQNLKHAIRTK